MPKSFIVSGTYIAQICKLRACTTQYSSASVNSDRQKVCSQVEWTQDDALVAVVASDCTVRVFDAMSGGLHHVLRGHEGRLYDCHCPRCAAHAFLVVCAQ